MNERNGKQKHRDWKMFGITLCAVAALAAGLFLYLMTHTQRIVDVIQTLAQDLVNTKNLYEPLHDPLQEQKDNGQFIITELCYSEAYPNSFLDITYPDEALDTARPTLVYFHGGGFFGGSKCDGDPLAEGDATALLDDMCAEGFNLVNIDYALVPEFRFPTPVIQANEAFRFLLRHAEEYHLDMDRVVIMGSSAGAILTSQLGSAIADPAYAELLGIDPVLRPEQVRALVIDDAPLDYDQLSLGTKVLVGNYVKGSIFLSREEKERYNPILWVTENSIPRVLLESEYHADMRTLQAALLENGVTHHLIDPLAERGVLMPHCFVAVARTDEIAKDAFNRMMAFIKRETEPA